MHVSRPVVHTAAVLFLVPLAAGCAEKVNDTVTATRERSASPVGPATPMVPAEPPQDPPPGAASPTPATPAEPAATEIKVGVAKGKVTPKAGARKVAKGKPVRIVVTSDKADEVHVHGYDKTAKIEAGKPKAIEFDATMPGKWEVELHEQELQLFSLQVQ
jgi:hypothetical protein